MNALRRATVVQVLEGAPEPWELVPLFREESWLSLLESTGEVNRLGRFTYLCADPYWVFRSKRGSCEAGPPDQLRVLEGSPLDELASMLERFFSMGGNVPKAGELPPFVGGFVGHLGYELLYLIERVPDAGRDDLALPDACLALHQTVIAHDHERGTTWLICHGMGEDEARAQRDSEHRIAQVLERIRSRVPGDEAAWVEQAREHRRKSLERRPRLTSADVLAQGITPVLDEPAYLGRIETAKEHIFAGDVFEICTTNRFDTLYGGSGEGLYRCLRAVNGAPFSAYLRFPDAEVMSASPERFVSLDAQGWAQTRPIKGTRPRGQTVEEDRAWKDDLARSEKDRAENVMIVDLARNDLGRVCELGTVTVPEFQILESYAFTHQMVSTVRGKLRTGCGPVDLLRAAFPGGSMTGAPKVEAMKLIDALEPVKRGIFSGSIGWLGFDGALDLSIVIRTFVKKGDWLTFHVGGAIVADSDPAEEHQEILDKAHGLVIALELARAGKGITP